MQGPLITIITVTFNAESCLEHAIQSVCSQRYPNKEYMIIDGGSTDGTINILQKYDDQIDYWLSEPDRGIYDAMNKGVALARGDWLYFLGADDILVNCLHRIGSSLKRKHTIYYGNVYMPFRNRVYAGRFDVIKLTSQNICQQAIFYPRSVFDKYRFSDLYPGAADYELNLHCWGDRHFRFRYIPELIAIFNDESTRKLDRTFQRDKERIISSTVGHLVPLARLKKNLQRRLSRKIRGLNPVFRW